MLMRCYICIYVALPPSLNNAVLMMQPVTLLLVNVQCALQHVSAVERESARQSFSLAEYSEDSLTVAPFHPLSIKS